MDTPRTAGSPRWLPLPSLLLALAAVTATACGSLEATVSAARATPDPTAAAAAPTPLATPTAPAFTTSARIVPLNGRPVGTPTLGRALSDDRVAEILELFLDPHPDPLLIDAALAEIVSNRDVRFIAVLIELMRAGPMQLTELTATHVDALQQLSGWGHSLSWDRWMEWYGETTLTPPPGFATWKGKLLAKLDARYGSILKDGRPAAIPVEQLVWSGANPDAVTPLDEPPFVAGSSDAARYLAPDEPVFGVYVNGEARAYPLRIMDVHEIANDVIGGMPVTLAYCTLTGSAALYDRRAPDGRTYSFSTSGLVYESNRLMYDRETESLWSPLSGRPVVGELVAAAGTGVAPWLDAYPVVTTRWDDWLARHPDTLVLDIDTGLGRSYYLGFPHLEYFASGNTAFPVSSLDTRQLTKSWVYGLLVGDTAKAYPLRAVLREGVVNDRVRDQDVVLVGEGSGRGIRVNGEMAMYGEMRYFAGGAVRAYARPEGVTFVRGLAGAVLDQDGRAWTVTEDALVSPEGETAARLFGRLTYWFGWSGEYPSTAIYDAPQSTAAP
ncbi:MAG: DUF3179 domain-containing protein [Dehalococcoidia bacterium]